MLEFDYLWVGADSRSVYTIYHLFIGVCSVSDLICSSTMQDRARVIYVIYQHINLALYSDLGRRTARIEGTATIYIARNIIKAR